MHKRHSQIHESQANDLSHTEPMSKTEPFHDFFRMSMSKREIKELENQIHKSSGPKNIQDKL